MKRILLVLCLMLMLSACTSTEEGTQRPGHSDPGTVDDDQKTKSIQTLSNYPEDVVPLYEATEVRVNEFTVRSTPGFVVGKDIYYISYESRGTRDEISNFYHELIDTMDIEWVTDKYSFAGFIGAYRISVSIPENKRPNVDAQPVNITIGIDPKGYMESNPYFEEIRPIFIEPIGVTTFDSEKISRNYANNIEQYHYIYQTEWDFDKVWEGYREVYYDKPEFTETEAHGDPSLRWKDHGYEWEIRASDRGSYHFVSLNAKRSFD